MKLHIGIGRLSILFASVLLLAASVGAQQKSQASSSRPQAYDLRREVSLQGTVVEYRPLSSTPPLGAHVTLKTASGIVDVHLGNPQLLTANHLSLTPGETVRVIGVNVQENQGTQFVARIVQKGALAIAVRSLQGIPLKPGRVPLSSAQAQKQQGGVL